MSRRVLPAPVPAFVQRIPIRFADVDVLDHVNHATLLTYCETVRCDWFEGLGYASMRALPFIIAMAHVEYKAPVPKTAKLDVLLTCPRIGGKSWEFDYVLKDAATGTEYATAKTVQVAYDYAAAKTIPVPEALRTALARLAPA